MKLEQLFYQQIRTSEAESGKVNEALVGVVTDNKDPDKLGRVKIKFPVLSEQDTSHWAPMLMQGAGKRRGWFFIPEVNDEVLVMFEQGDLNRPIVVAAMWNGKDKPSDKNSGGNPRRVIKSRAGSRIVFDDEKDQLVIEDGKGVGRITFDAKANKITIEALKGDVCLQSPAGEMKILANEAKLEAGAKLEINAGSTMAFGSGGSTKISGSSVVLAGMPTNVHVAATAPPMPSTSPQEVADPYGS
jgi:uncharacterized protein involved in type VI secretion and phage assembly